MRPSSGLRPPSPRKRGEGRAKFPLPARGERVPEGRVRGVLIAAALLLTTHLFAVPDSCTEGGAAFSALSASEVDAMVKAAAASTNINTLTIAVVDRAGRPLALY